MNDLLRSSYIVVPDEIDALRDKAEFVDEYAAQLKSEKWIGDRRRELWFTLARRFDEFTEAAREAVAVLEDMYEQRDEEVERWFGKWMDAYEAVEVWRSNWRSQRDESERLAEQNAELAEQRDDYADRLRGSNEDYRKLQVKLSDAEARADLFKRANENQARMLERVQNAALRGNSDSVLAELDDASDYE